MQKLTKDGAIEEVNLEIIRDLELVSLASAETTYLIPYEALLTDDELKTKANIGVWLKSDSDIETLQAAVEHSSIIGIDFPVFTDGRGFSIARTLRDTYGYTGELVAIGQFMQDQLFYLKRCGFDAFQLEKLTSVESLQTSLKDFSKSYQTACDVKGPLFSRIS